MMCDRLEYPVGDLLHCIFFDAAASYSWGTEPDTAWAEGWQRVIWNAIFVERQTDCITRRFYYCPVEVKTFLHICKDEVVTRATRNEIKAARSKCISKY